MRSHRVTICTMGDTGHGKTSLVRAILKHCDPNYEACRSGRVMVPCNHEFCTAAKTYGITDLPSDKVVKLFCDSREPYRLDGAILVVSAADGVTLNVRKQVSLSRWFGVPVVVPFLSKSDLVDQAERLQNVKRSVRTLLYQNGYGVFDVPVIHGAFNDNVQSSVSACDNLNAFIDLLDRKLFSPYA